MFGIDINKLDELFFLFLGFFELFLKIVLYFFD